MNFSGKVVMVTGGMSGIGAACVNLFVSHGASVISLDMAPSVDPRPPQDPHRLALLQGNVACAHDVAWAVEVAVERFGHLDIGVNCAGILGARLPLIDQDDDALDELFSVNVRGIYLSAKYQLRAMLARGTRGAIINVASVFGLRALETFGLYSATKHAVIGLTKAAAVEVGPRGIRVNAVAPGPVRTPFIGVLAEEAEKVSASRIPLKRIGEPSDVAAAIAWLASDEACFITGAIFAVDGGITARMSTG